MKKMSRKLAAPVILAATMLMPLSAQAASGKKAVALKVTGAGTVHVGSRVRLKVKTSAKARVTYKSGNQHIATVSGKGVITGKSVGSVKITITAKPVKTSIYKKTTASVVIRVKQPPHEEKHTVNKIEIKTGQTASAAITPLGGDLNILAGSCANGRYDITIADELIALVNRYRKANGLNELAGSQVLTSAAGIRAQEITKKFSHTRPDGSRCFTVSAYVSGENLSCGYSSAQDIFNAWKDSASHNAVMLGDGFKAVGVGVFVKRTSMFGITVDSYFAALEMGR